MMTETETTRTETRTIREWLSHQTPEPALVEIIEYPQHGVALVLDGQETWAADIPQLEEALDREVTWTIHTDETGTDRPDEDARTPCAGVAYTLLCQDVEPLSGDIPSVRAVCEDYGIDPGALYS